MRAVCPPEEGLSQSAQAPEGLQPKSALEPESRELAEKLQRLLEPGARDELSSLVGEGWQ